MTQFRDVCEAAARAGGGVLQEMRGRINPQEKAPKDLVTEADFASQETIRQVIAGAFPKHGFLGEEGPPQPVRADSVSVAEYPEYCWVVDPLDGTLNYTRQLPNYSVSVALRQADQVICGVVYEPVRDECFVAELGQGATLNGQPIGTSSCQLVERALIAASLPADIPRVVDGGHYPATGGIRRIPQVLLRGFVVDDVRFPQRVQCQVRLLNLVSWAHGGEDPGATAAISVSETEVRVLEGAAGVARPVNRDGVVPADELERPGLSRGRDDPHGR